MQPSRMLCAASTAPDAGMDFWHDRVRSPLGSLLVVVDREGRLRALEFDTHQDRMRRLMSRTYGAATLRDGAAPAPLRRAIEAYFAGEFAALDSIETAAAGTTFQCRVWTALRDIPPGRTESYGALAARLGMPSASRAVGLANGSNPVGIVVPCHRVIGANGALTGYGGGIERKRWLLAHEGAALRSTPAQSVLPFVSQQTGEGA